MGIYRTLLLSFAFIAPVVLHAEVAKIVFTSEPQTIRPGELSGPLTIQTQDSAGAAFKTPETIDLEFTSTSATGEFLGSTGNAATKTMSTNTSNRTFYYKDSATGAFVLTIRATGRTSGSKWETSQIINVSSGGTTATSSETADSSQAESSTGTAGAASAHYSAAPITNIGTDSAFKVGAGRQRLASTGTPIEFRASANSETRDASYTWTFGDGSIGYGEVVSHTYMYPGEYVVVLRGISQSGQAVSRTEVRVVDAKLSIIDASPVRVEISNASLYEINLFGRSLSDGASTFAFPEDTIIKPGQRLSFPHFVTGLSPKDKSSVALLAPGEKFTLEEIKADPERQKAIEEVAMKLSHAQKVLYDMLTAEEEVLKLAVATTTQAPPQTASAVQTVEYVKGTWLNTLKRFFGF